MSTQNKTLGQLMKSRSHAVFTNDKGEFINVGRYYQKNTLKFMVIFSKGLGDIATRLAIHTTSEKRVLKLINEEGFKFVQNYL